MGQRRTIAGSRMLITGASQGIGRALALAAVLRGAKVLAAARNLDLLRELQAEAAQGPGKLVTVQADVTSPEDRLAMAQAAVEHFGGLDLLINNAGIGATGHFADVSLDHLRKIMEVNFFGLTETTRAVLPLLKTGNKPAVVNISSIAGRRGIPARSHYSCSKFAVQGFSEALRTELYKDGVDVLVVNPGLTQTNFSKNMLEQRAKVKMDHLRGMTAEEAARLTLRAIERGKNETTLTLQGKLLVFVARFLPGLADRIVKKRVRELFKDEIQERKQPERQIPMHVG